MEKSSPKARPTAQPLVSLEQVFEGSLFRVPDYQRGYAWGLDEYGVFWDDLCRMGDARIHYVGQLTVREALTDETLQWEEERNLLQTGQITPYFVVDGQQRLTTAVILLKCLTECLDANACLAGLTKTEIEHRYLYHSGQLSRVYLFGYAVGGACYEFFKAKVLGQSSSEVHQADSLYTMNLRDAREFFTEKLSALSLPELDVTFQSLTKRLLFNWSNLVPELDESVVFETMNNRGKKVSNLELLKNRLIQLSKTLPGVSKQDSRDLRKRINLVWATAYEELGRTRNGALNDDEAFLSNHTTMYFNRWWKEPEFLLDEEFTVARVLSGDVGLSAIAEYVESIRRTAKTWRQIHLPSLSADLSDELRQGLDRLNRISHGAFMPLLMAALQFGGTSPQAIAGIVEAAEGFRFAVGALCRRRSNTGETHFYGLSHRIIHGRQSLEGAIAEIDDWTSRHFGLDRAINESEDRFRHNNGFYSWHYLRFLLFEYEQFVRIHEFEMGVTKLDWAEFTQERRSDFGTVEHILPDKPREGEWLSFSHYTPDQVHRLTHSLGNLLPLSRSRNSHLSNRAFLKKRGDDGTVLGYSSGCYSEIAVSKFSDWTPAAIVERGLSILRFVERRWKAAFGTPEERLSFLGLGFLKSDQPQAGNAQ